MDAISLKNIILAAASASIAFLTEGLGGCDAAMRVLITLMVADYLTGMLLAAVWHRSNKSETGGLDSRAGFKGLCRKCMILLLIWIAVLLDTAFSFSYVRMMVILFFVGNEGLSLLENMGMMGVPYPEFLKRALEALKDKGNSGE